MGAFLFTLVSSLGHVRRLREQKPSKMLRLTGQPEAAPPLGSRSGPFVAKGSGLRLEVEAGGAWG
jgi:hypothetical protein